ncbi:MAG: sulfatase [Cyclobacteriaceae bacterium]
MIRVSQLFLFAGSLILLLTCCEQRKENSQRTPNVVLILIDDLNDWVRCMDGHPLVKTPNIDKLASMGVLFTNAHAQTAICNPSRVSFMTGLYPSSTGIYFNTGNIEDSPAASKGMLMTGRFEKEGYNVIGAGKLYSQGDLKYMTNHAGRFGGFGPLPDEKLTKYEGHQLWDWGIYPEEDTLTPDFKVAEWAVNQLKSGLQEPFFLGVGFFRPHVPMYAPQKYFDLYPLDSIQIPQVNPQDLEDLSEYAINLTRLEHIEPSHEWIIENNEWKHLVQAYLASISFVDTQVGKVLNALEGNQLEENTYILLVSDHGFHLGEKQVWAKQTLWEESTRVPLIIAGPGIPSREVCEKPVQLLDIYPTLLDLTELEADDYLEGRSLRPLLVDSKAPWPYIARSSFGPGNYAIRSENFRYIKYLDGSEEFYDHTIDESEWNNLIGDLDYKEKIAWHRSFLPTTNGSPILGSGSTGHKAYAASGAILQSSVNK